MQVYISFDVNLDSRSLDWLQLFIFRNIEILMCFILKKSRHQVLGNQKYISSV